MKKLIFTTVFFFVSVFSFSQKYFMTDNFRWTYECNKSGRATYNITTNKVSDISINNFDFEYEETVKYDYNDKIFIMTNGRDVITLENIYVEVDDDNYNNDHYVNYKLYKKVNVNDKTYYFMVGILKFYDSVSKKSYMIVINHTEK